MSAEERKSYEEGLKSLEETAAALNKSFSLPHDISVGFDHCEEANAFYDPEGKKITVCYELAFAGARSLDQQRYYNLICLLYGQHEEKFASLVQDGTLPPTRAERGSEEFARADKAWDALLAPYAK